MNLEMTKEKIDEYFASGKAKIYFEKLTNKEKMKEFQLERFFKKVYNDEIDFDEIVKKIIEKYDNKSYYRRHMKRGVEPPERLYFFLYEFAKTYGKEVNEHQWMEFSNMFTCGMYIFGMY
jgi:hypothetical protein